MLALAGAAPASAALVFFQLVSAQQGLDARFSLERSPTPVENLGTGFRVVDVPVSFGGAAAQPSDITFFTASQGGGLDLVLQLNGVDYSAGGDVLFDGSLDMPTFRLGSFALTDVQNPAIGYNLTIGETPPDGGTVVPEPAAWALMLTGFGLVGGVIRRRTPVLAAA